MNKKIILSASALLMMSMAASAQIGKPYIHDPSSIVVCDGKYYTYGTGGGGLVSEDGWTWTSLPREARPGGGAAPDAMKIGDKYLIAYSTTGGGLGGGHAGSVVTMWNKTLDPNSPDFKYTEPVQVAFSEMNEDCDAIDAGLLMGPDGRLWCTYGTYFGFIRQVELDPKTGFRKEGNVAKDVAIDCEASTMMYRDGWYYLLGTHGTCCDGVNSTYNIVVGRSRNPQGPFYDNVGRDMLKGGGKMVVAAEDRAMGAGHFGRFIEEDGVEKMSFHWEADLDQSGRSVLAIRPIVWKDGWPVAGQMVEAGTYEIESVRRGYALELSVDFQRMNVARRGGFGAPATDEPEISIPNQTLEEVIGSWPTGNIDVRANDYMSRPSQKWVLTPCPELGATIAGPYYKITIAGTNRALAASAEAEVITVPEFTGADEQLWRIDQLTDGTFRIMPKAIPGCNEKYALVSLGDSSPTLAKFDMSSDNSKWNLIKRK
ncbi:MAG: family 43 glycosylhydrolase [Bacteroidales bacterium]|nr:family 43 glycosylhydrolase [Bacteroidales bacterium]